MYVVTISMLSIDASNWNHPSEPFVYFCEDSYKDIGSGVLSDIYFSRLRLPSSLQVEDTIVKEYIFKQHTPFIEKWVEIINRMAHINQFEVCVNEMVLTKKERELTLREVLNCPEPAIDSSALPNSRLQATLLSRCLKPHEITGDTYTREQRAEELVKWFEHYARGQANQKWLEQHAFELAHYIAEMKGM